MVQLSGHTSALLDARSTIGIVHQFKVLLLIWFRSPIPRTLSVSKATSVSQLDEVPHVQELLCGATVQCS
jgi:hypothetical protein